jgi:orotidine-5'-phosphate decarboxylase
MADVIVALDMPDQTRALRLVDALGDAGTFYKVGLELYTREGPAVVRALRERGKRVFLDLKLHDIPNTVAGAVRAAAELDVELLTVHATGGEAMMAAAAEAAARARLRLLAVTVLTSLGAAGVRAVWGRDGLELEGEVVRLATQAAAAGITGVVSSAHEVRSLRDRLGPEAYLVTPGIRLTGGASHDQARVATPDAAVRAGADALVVGRAVVAAPDPPVALARILALVASAGAAGAPGARA